MDFAPTRRFSALCLFIVILMGLGLPMHLSAQSLPAPQPAAAQPPVQYTVIPAANPGKAVIGSNDPKSGMKLQVRITYWGAGLYEATLTDYRQFILKNDPYLVLAGWPTGMGGFIYPLAARTLVINDQPVDLQSAKWDLLPGADANRAAYVVRIAGPDGKAVVEVERIFSIAPGSYEVHCAQRVTNLSATDSLRIVFSTNSIGDIQPDEKSYMGDRREFGAGYFNLDYDPAKNRIYTSTPSSFCLGDLFTGSGTIAPRSGVVSTVINEKKSYWPTRGLPNKHELAWLASVNRYFALAVHRPVPDTVAAASRPASLIAPLDQLFPTVGTDIVPDPSLPPHDQQLVLTLTSKLLTIPAGGTERFDLALFAGPRDPALFENQPFHALGFPQLVIYNLGGICAFCTFQPLAQALFWFLNVLHAGVRDWGLAIIILVLVVRAILHPITRNSQVGMAKMQKQMASIQPEIAKLKKKFGDDKQKLQAETMKLYKEKGINPLNMLGCLPMFLQMPIWVALYAMLYYAIELRHQGAFYGVFQAITGGQWSFLSDLSSPDHFIPLGRFAFTIPLLGWEVDALNALPILMAVAFFLQTKFTPQPAPTNEQAAQQAKMMKWMTLLFPLMLYKSPSGLNLYIMASTFAGIVDSILVRRHIKREEEAGTLFTKKPGLLSRWMSAAQSVIETRQKNMGDNNKLQRRK